MYDLAEVGCPENLYKLVASFHKREIIAIKESVLIRKTYSRGYIQRSNSDLLLWNIICNRALQLDLSRKYIPPSLCG